jgi:hypothetical protein
VCNNQGRCGTVLTNPQSNEVLAIGQIRRAQRKAVLSWSTVGINNGPYKATIHAVKTQFDITG